MPINRALDSLPLKGRVYKNLQNFKLYYVVGFVNDFHTNQELIIFTEITTGKQYSRLSSEWLQPYEGRTLHQAMTKIDGDYQEQQN